MKFSQMPYKRPELSAVKAEFTELIDSLNRAEDYTAALWPI